MTESRQMLASLDGQIQPAAEAVIPITDEGLLRGDGAFEVIRLYGGVPFALDEHLERMSRTAAGIRLPLDTAAYEREVAALLAADPPGDAQLRLVATRGGRRLAIVEPLATGPDTLALRTVTYSPPRLLDDIKSLSYAANMLATRIAVEAGSPPTGRLCVLGNVEPYERGPNRVAQRQLRSTKAATRGRMAEDFFWRLHFAGRSARTSGDLECQPGIATCRTNAPAS